MEEAAPQSILLTIKEVDEENESVCDGGDSTILQVKVEIPELILGDLSTATVNRQQAMDSLEMEEWRKGRRKKKCKMASPNDKLVVEARIFHKRNVREDGEVKKYKCRVVT